MRSLFFKKLRCKHCGGSFKLKSERGKRNVYVCTNYDLRNGKCNKRVAIPEDTIINAVNKRYEIRKGITLSEKDVASKIKEIVIEDRLLFQISLEDFEDDIVYGTKHIIY